MERNSNLASRGSELLVRASRSQRLPRAVRQGFRKVSGADDLRERYIDLIEKAVTHTLYFPFDNARLPARFAQPFVQHLSEEEVDAHFNFTDAELREDGLDWPIYAQTMVGLKRIRNVRDCVESILADRIPGDLIEAGSWRGGIAILKRGILEAHDVRDRVVWAADSFAGLPAPDPERFPADAGDIGHTAEELRVSVEEVRNNFARYGLYDSQVRLLEGWFRDTLPTVRDRRWALVRLDGDLYESTMDGLTNLYPQLSPGGYLIVDDYGWENCRAAVEDFRREHAITEPIERIDWVGAFWRKRG